MQLEYPVGQEDAGNAVLLPAVVDDVLWPELGEREGSGPIDVFYCVALFEGEPDRKPGEMSAGKETFRGKIAPGVEFPDCRTGRSGLPPLGVVH